MSFYGNDFDWIKTKKPYVLGFDLLSMKYVGIDFVKSREGTLFGVLN